MSVEQNPQPIICPQCGQTNAQGKRECWNCKASLVPGTQPTKKKTSCWLAGCIIAAGFGLILTIIIIIAVMHFRGGGFGARAMEMEEAIQSTVVQKSPPVPNKPKTPAQMPATTAKPKVK